MDDGIVPDVDGFGADVVEALACACEGFAAGGACCTP